MKKIIALILAVLMLVSMVACGNTNDNDVSNNGETTNNVAGNETNADSNAPEVAPSKSAVEVINGAIGKFCEVLAATFEMSAEDVKGSFVGGYFSDDETTITMGEAAKHPVNVQESVEALKTFSLMTDAEIAKIDDAATLYHMMNTNNFSASAMRVVDAGEVDAFANTMKSLIANNRWMCGFPERYLVVKVDTCVISVYGLTDNVNAFKTALTETYDNAVVVCDEAFA